MSKYERSERKKDNKNENKIHKKKRKHSSPSNMRNNDSDEFEWVEKVEKQTFSSQTEGKVVNKTQEESLERSEWMNIESFLPCSSSMSKQKRDIREAGRAKELDKPGQSNRELNPYWKDGGDGLPQNDVEKRNSLQIMDANWLRKSLRRAEEQALRDNKSLEQVAAERWGSLETIQSMIAKAEKMSSVERDKSNYKKYYNDKNKNNEDLHKNSDSEIKNYLKSSSSSRTRSHGNEKYKTSNYRSQYVEQQRTYRKPKDDNNDFFNQTTAHKFSNNRIKNWKKDKTCEKKCETISELEKPSEKTDVANPSNTNEEEKNKTILTEAEMNKLGARIIKAELMGDDELAAELKDQLDEARKVASNTNVQEKSVTRTKIAAEDVVRPSQLESQSKHTQFSKGYRNKVPAETHVSSERVAQFVNNDKYSLEKMFQYEKGMSRNEAKLASTSTNDMDDIDDDVSDQQNASKKAKRFKEDCTYASKKPQDSSKYVDNCWWCLDSKNILKHMIVTMDSMICLSLPAHTSLTTNHCILTPTQHVACQLQVDEDVWERLKEFKTKLIKMFTNENLYPIFFEVYKKRQKYTHMQLKCIPLPKEIGELAPIYFKKALLECEMEWSVNKKIVDLKHKNIRHAVPNGLSYFIVEFASHPGYAHVIEDEETFPKNFAEEIIGGMLDLNCNLWRKPKRQSFDEQRSKVLEFTELWTKYNPLCS